MAVWKSDGSDGGSAFPMSSTIGEHGAEWGMSLRDWFAGQTIIGVLPGRHVSAQSIADTAEAAYRLADAMLRARDAGGT